MNSLLDAQIVPRVGWTLVHSLWQLTIVVAIVLSLNSILARNRAAVRYIIGCVGLLACVVVPTVTFAILEFPPAAGADEVVENTNPTDSSVANAIVPQVDHATFPAESGVSPNVTTTASNMVSSNVPAEAIVPSIAQRFSAGVDPWLPGVFYGWILGVLVCSMRPLAGFFRIRKLRTHGQSVVPESVMRTFHDACEQLRLNRAAQIAQSTLVEIPCVVGYFKPLILLPASAITGLSQAELRTIIVHELAHVRRHDYLVNLFQTVIESLLFFHPMVWWLSSQVRTDRENCCDDIVLDCGEDRSEYIRALIQMEEIKQPTFVMAATNGPLVQRIRRMVGKQQTRVGNGWLAGLIVILLLALLPVSHTANLWAAYPDEKIGTKETVIRPAERTITVTVVNEAGAPITNAQIESQLDKDKRQTHTDMNGRAVVELAEEPPAEFSIRAAGEFVPLKATWRNSEDDEPDPIPDAITFHVNAGKKISGRVIDQNGNPVAGATIKPAYYGLAVHASRRIQNDWSSETRITDTHGNWTFEHVDPSLARFDAQVFHPEFANDSIRFDTKRKKAHVLEMRPGVSIRGTITDPSGKPLTNTQVLLMPKYATPGSWTTRTNERGEYEFNHVKRDEIRLIVVDKSFAPKTEKLRNLEGDTTVDFELKKGTPLKFKFVDATGRSVEGVRVTCVYWVDGRGLDKFDDAIPRRSNASGIWLWKNALQSRLGFSFHKSGYLRHNFVHIQQSDEHHEYTMHPVLNVSGSVTDKETGQLIKNFTVLRGNWANIPFGQVADEQGGIAWDVYGARPMHNGKYNLRITQMQKEHYVKVEAPGYRPAVSRAFTNNEGSLTFDFQLQPSEGLKGQVLDQAGKPIPGAEVHYVLPGRHIEVRNGVIEDGLTIKTVSDSGGNFRLPEQDQDFAIMVIADEGYAFLGKDEFQRARQIKISRWATVRGHCMIGNRPAVGEEVGLNIQRDEHIAENIQASQWYNATVQEDGVFEMKRVPPNVVGEVGRLVRIERDSGGRIGSYSHAQQITTRPTRVARVDIGGTGRPVIGKVKLPDDSKRKVKDWNWSVSSIRRVGRNDDAQGHPTYFPFGINEDGSFRIEDVSAGDYQFSIMALDMDAPDDQLEIGRIQSTFKIPEIEGGQSNEPLDVGELEVTLVEPSKP